MSVATCTHCDEAIIQRAGETYYVHTRTGMAQCGIRYATPVNPTADETRDLSTWTRFDLDAFWEGLNGIEPIGAMSEVIKGSSSGTISYDTESTEVGMTESVSNPAQTTNDRICEHDWVNKAGAGYRENPVEVCVKCGEEL
jgi:hypothetical protein